MKFNLKQVDFYTILWCIYYMQGSFYSAGSLFAKVILFIILIISLYYLVYSYKNYKLPKVLRVLGVLILVLSLYGLVFWALGDDLYVNGSRVRGFDYIRNILVSFTPIYAFYNFSQKGQITEQWLFRWAFIFLAICIAGFYGYNKVVLEEAVVGERTNNMGYTILSLIVLVPVLYKKQWLQYLYMAIVAFYFILSIKRGAIVVGLVSLVVFILLPPVEGGTNNRPKKKLWVVIIKIVFSIVFVIVGVNFLQSQLENNEYLNMRYQMTLEGNASGRENISSQLMHYLENEATIIQILFGGGVYKTIQITGAAAHNDWLEFMVDNGIFVTILYLYYWIVMAKTAFKSPKNQVFAQILILFIVNYFLRTFFSMSYSNISVYASCALGYALSAQNAEYFQELKQTNHEKNI